jgi:hypothetical protein
LSRGGTRLRRFFFLSSFFSSFFDRHPPEHAGRELHYPDYGHEWRHLGLHQRHRGGKVAC